MASTGRRHDPAFAPTVMQVRYPGATSPRQARHQVTMQLAHHAGLLRVDKTPLLAAPPQYDPQYPVAGEVMTRDLAVYEQYAAACGV